MGEGAKEATGITLATMVLGAIAIAAGAGDAGLGLMMMGQQAALGQLPGLHPRSGNSAPISRARAISPRQASAARAASSSSRSCRTRNIASRSMRRTATTGPTRFRASASQCSTNLYKKDPAWNKPTDPALEAQLPAGEGQAARLHQPEAGDPTNIPKATRRVPAHYARAYAYHLGAYPDKALSEADALLKTNPHDPYFLELKGQILLECGQAGRSDRAASRGDRASRDDAPLIAAMLGHALIATEKRGEFRRGEGILKTAVAATTRIRSPGTSSE